MGEENSPSKETLEKSSVSEKPTSYGRRSAFVYLTLSMAVVLAFVILDVLQFYIHPVDVKIDHIEVFLTSPTATTEVTPNDFSVSLFLNFETGSSFFSTGLSST